MAFLHATALKKKSDDDNDIIETDNDSRVNVEGTDDLWPDYLLPILYNYTGRVFENVHCQVVICLCLCLGIKSLIQKNHQQMKYLIPIFPFYLSYFLL